VCVPLACRDHGAAALEPLHQARDPRGGVEPYEQVDVRAHDPEREHHGPLLPSDIPQKPPEESRHLEVDKR
jgi:hypothetical protein